MPESGYKVARVYVDDDLVPAARSYTFKDVVEDHTLRVEFEKTGPTLVYPTNWSNPFTDVHAGDWFYDSVKFMNGNGFDSGYFWLYLFSVHDNDSGHDCHYPGTVWTAHRRLTTAIPSMM